MINFGKMNNMKGRFLIALVGFVLVNLAVWKFSPFEIFTKKNTLSDLVKKHDEMGNAGMSKTWPWWIATSYLREPQAPDVLIMGDSQMATAIFTSDAQSSGKAVDVVSHRHVETLEKKLFSELSVPVSVFNAAIAGSMASDYDLTARALFLDCKTEKPKLVIIGISPRAFIDNTLPSASATDTFRFYSQCADPGRLAQFAFPDYLGQLSWYLNKYLPLSKLKGELQAHLPSFISPKSTSKHGNPKTDFMQGMFASATRIDRNEWFVPANIPYLFKDNTKEYVQRYGNPNPPLYPGELVFFDDLLHRLQKANVPTLVVEMPSLSPNQKLLPDSFWQVYRSNVQVMCRENNAKFVDLSSTDFIIDDYLDTVHLNCHGGLKLIDNLASIIEKDENLTTGIGTRTVATGKSTSKPQ